MIRWPATELDPTSFPAWRDAIARYDADPPAAPAHEPRTYPGYPTTALPPPRRRWRSSLDRALAARRSTRAFDGEPPSAAQLSQVLALAHRATATGGRGAVPSAGGLQALELYLAVLSPPGAGALAPPGAGALAPAVYHYDRAGHLLARVAEPLGRDADRDLVPALVTLAGAPLLWIVVGDTARVEPKYGARGLRFLLLEAGHLMQNLCIASADVGLATVPLGGFYERALAAALRLPPADEVLYVGACGRPSLAE